MPRYFFHVYDDLITRDQDGIDFPDAEAACAAAVAGAREMMCDQLMKGRLCLYHCIEVEDARGKAILTLPFGDAVRIEAAGPNLVWFRGT